MSKKSDSFILVAVLAAMVLVFTTAGCNDDDDTETITDDITPEDTESERDTGSDSDADSDGDSDSDSDADSDADSDGDTEVIETEGGDVEEGEECMSPAMFHMMRGVCQQPSATCEGGYPDALVYKKIFPEALIALVPLVPAPGMGPLPDAPSATANCLPGLKCCLNTDECEHFNTEFKSYPIIGTFISGVKCVEQGKCNGGTISNAAEFGCEAEQKCCFTFL
ncbi:MAG: hypothetical protein GY847_04325 [Proteobacteria bacterium]|nr:hypothetical protein [Pseudomonadota bacterium]